jgi:hypothetical protein
MVLRRVGESQLCGSRRKLIHVVLEYRKNIEDLVGPADRVQMVEALTWWIRNTLKVR